MLKKTIFYENFDGERVEEDHYFHLGTKTIILMEEEARVLMGRGEGDPGTAMEAWITREVDSKDPARILAVFGKFIDRGYGIRVGDTGFKQSTEISNEFSASLAFDAFFSEMMTSEDEAVTFILGMMPTQLMGALKKDVNQKLREAGFSEEAIQKPLAEKTARGRVIENVEVRSFGSALPAEPVISVATEPTNPVDPEDTAILREREELLSGLRNPRDHKGDLVPWAFREATPHERRTMSEAQFIDLTHRRNSNEWEPTVGG